jgi:hypothetical protein
MVSGRTKPGRERETWSTPTPMRHNVEAGFTRPRYRLLFCWEGYSSWLNSDTEEHCDLDR